MNADPDPLLVVTGAFGLVGRVLMREVPEALAPLNPPGGPRVDVADGDAVRSRLRAAIPTGRRAAVVHLAALTDTRSLDRAAFERVNVRGTENVMEAALAAGAAFIHVSTDYVFAGESRPGAFLETDRPALPPPGAYAASKFHAENLVLDAAKPRTAVARIAFPYGGTGNRPGLSEKLSAFLVEARRTGRPARFFQDQRICPSYLPDVARGLLSLARLLAAGSTAPTVCHLAGRPTTPYEFGSWVRDILGPADAPLEPCPVSTGYAANLVLSTAATEAALDWRPTPHQEALRLLSLSKEKPHGVH